MWFELLKRDITSDDIVEMPDEVAERAKELLDSVVRDSPHAEWIDSDQISLTPNWLPIGLNEAFGNRSGFPMGLTSNNVGKITREMQDHDWEYFDQLAARSAVWTEVVKQMHITEIIVSRRHRWNCVNYSVNKKSSKSWGMGLQSIVSPEVYPINLVGCFDRHKQGNLPNDDKIASLILSAGEKSTWFKIWKDV
jgi:hypothetical protein